MEEFDIGRVLPLLVIWAVYWLINRRSKKRPEEPPVTEQADDGRLPLEALELPPLEYKASETVRPEPVYYYPPLAPGGRASGSMPAPAASFRHHHTASGYRNKASRRTLRRIVIWSEIIAPPVGLREEGERRL
jgi:hypothetical protein